MPAKGNRPEAVSGLGLLLGFRFRSAFVGLGAGLADLTLHHWRVEAVDVYGATRLSESRAFTTDNTNGEFRTIMFGYVLDGVSRGGVGGATVDVAVDAARWKAAVIGDPVPPPAAPDGAKQP